MKKSILTLFAALSLGVGAQGQQDATQKSPVDSVVTVTPPTAQKTQADTLPRLDPAVESVFKGMGLELRTMIYPTPDAINFFVHPDDALRLPKDIIMAVFQDKPEDASPNGNNTLLVPEYLFAKGDTAGAVAKIFRGDCSVIFFKNDGSNVLSKENMLGYSIVEETEITAKSPLTETTRIVMIMPDRKYTAWFQSDGKETWVSKPRLEKQTKEPRTPRAIVPGQ